MLSTTIHSTDDPSGGARNKRAGGVRAELKEATAQLHQALDRALQGALRDRQRYAAFLRGSHAAIAWLEPSLARHGGAAQSDANRLECIESDLAELGAAAPPARSFSFRPASAGEALGCAYVMEGSALGGLVLAKSMDSALSLGGKATSFLRFRGPETMSHWRAFLQRLEQWGETAPSAEHRAAARGAEGAFQVYREAFAAEGLL